MEGVGRSLEYIMPFRRDHRGSSLDISVTWVWLVKSLSILGGLKIVLTQWKDFGEG